MRIDFKASPSKLESTSQKKKLYLKSCRIKMRFMLPPPCFPWSAQKILGGLGSTTTWQLIYMPKCLWRLSDTPPPRHSGVSFTSNKNPHIYIYIYIFPTNTFAFRSKRELNSKGGGKYTEWQTESRRLRESVCMGVVWNIRSFSISPGHVLHMNTLGPSPDSAKTKWFSNRAILPSSIHKVL
jgi:hypothetical protein